MSTNACAELISTACIRYSVTVSNDIITESWIIKTKTLPFHTNCIGYSNLGCSDKSGITIGRREAKRTILREGNIPKKSTLFNHAEKLIVLSCNALFSGVPMRFSNVFIGPRQINESLLQ